MRVPTHFHRRAAGFVASVLWLAWSNAASAAWPLGNDPDATVQALAAAPGASDAARLAQAALLAELAELARGDSAASALDALARTSHGRLASELQVLAAALRGASEPSVVSELALLGPLADNGEGLLREDPPEARGLRWSPTERYPQGPLHANWRVIPGSFASARGLPLDVFIEPRRESCAYVVTFVQVPHATRFVVSVAGSGSLRLLVDGRSVATDDELHEGMRFDRLAATVHAEAGEHSLGVKVCTAPLGDVGRVRLRLQGEDGAASGLSLRASGRGGELAPSRAEPLPTPLREALSRGTVGERFVLLTAGAADDSRTRRAHALASQLAASGEPSALALAAWLSPAATQRSQLALREAAAQTPGDAARRGFFLRKQMQSALDGRLPEQALQIAQQARLTDARDAEASLLRLQLAQRFGTAFGRAEVEQALRPQVLHTPAQAASALLAHWARHASSPRDRQLAAAELVRRGAAGGYLLGALTERSARAEHQAAVHALFAGGAQNADELEAGVRLLQQRGLLHEARPFAHLLVHTIAPNRASALRLAADLAKRAGDAAQVGPLLARAAALAPADAALQAELALREPSPRDGDATRPWDERYLVSSARALQRRTERASAAFAERQLYWLRAVQLHEDGRVSQLMHYTREIGLPTRSEDDRYEPLPAEADLTQILRAVVHRKDGTTAWPSSQSSDAYDTHIEWPPLEVGDVVEVAVRQWTARSVGGRSDPPYYVLDFGGSTETRPLLENHVLVAHPKDKPLHVSVQRPGSLERTRRQEDGLEVTELRWDRPHNVADEPLAPPMTELVPLVVMSSYGSWAEFFTWYREAVRKFAEPDDEIRRLALSLTAGKSSREAKIKALFEFVADTIRYVNYQSGEWWLPNRPQEVLARREGDCDDKALLLISLLAAVGIHAEEVLVQTRMTDMPSVLTAPGVAAPLFDHGIAYLPGPGGGQYLDATSPGSRLGPLPAMDARALGARIDQHEIVTLPDVSPEQHGRHGVYRLQLQADGSGTLRAHETHSGDAAFWLRTQLNEDGGREHFVEESLLPPLAITGKVTGKVQFVPEAKLGQATVSYHVEAISLARRDRDALVASLTRPSSLVSSYAALAQRTLPLVLPPDVAPSHDVREFTVQAPAGYRALAPQAGSVVTAFGRAELQVKLKSSRELTLSRSLRLDKHRIEPSEYPAFRRFMQQADALLRQGVRFERGER